MNQHLTTLIELQGLDNSIRALKSEIETLPRKVAEIEAQLADHIAAVEADKKKVADNQKSRRQREGEISSFREKISKHRSQMLEVKTNEQYKALVHEIEFHEVAIRKIEDQILAEMVESEALDKQLKESEKALAVEKSKVQEQVKQAQQRRQVDETSLASHQEQREAARARLDSRIYATYMRISGARRGTGITELVVDTCAACHVRLRPQAINEVMTNEQIIQCESCGCILYFVPPPPSEKEAKSAPKSAPKPVPQAEELTSQT